MKKTTFLTKAAALLIVVLFSLTGARAETLTVYDGTNTNPYVPAYLSGVYAQNTRYYVGSEFIIPATQLSAMNGGTITAVKFYTNGAISGTTPTFNVYVKEVTNTAFTSNTTTFTTDGTTVYTGTLTTSNNEVTITFNSPFEYKGGNLLIGMKSTSRVYTSFNTTFYGQDNHTNAACYGRTRNQTTTASTSMASFIPKTTFTYTVPAPTNVTVSNIGPNTATVSWDGIANATGYELQYGAGDYAGKKTLKYDNGERVGTVIGQDPAQTQTWGVMYPASQVTGSQLSHVSIYETAFNTGDITINIYSGGNNAPGTLLHTETVATEAADAFHVVKFATPVTITPGANLWITLTETGTYVKALCSSTEANNQWMYYNGDGNWYNISAFGDDLDGYGFMIRAEINNGIDPSSITWNTINPATSPCSITGLNPETNYIVRVKALYDGGNESPWTVSDFVTTISNPVATDIAVTPSSTSANISWTGYADSYEVKYKNVIFFDNFDNGLGQWTIRTEGQSRDGYDGWIGVNGWASSYSWYGGNVGALSADNWLISPAVDLRGTLSFWAWANYSDEYEVLLSTSGTEIGDFTTTLKAMGAAPSPGAVVSIDLSAYEGQTGYIAIHHVFRDGYFLNIDNFEISDEWKTVTTTTPSVELTSLIPETEYEFIITGIKEGCPNASTSPMFFTTLPMTDPIPVTISYVGYGTLYYSNLNLKVPEGVEAYTYSYVEGNNRLSRSKIYTTDDVIPAGEPVALKAAPGTYNFYHQKGYYTPVEQNLLKGTDVAGLTTGGNVYYALAIKRGSNDPSTIGFYWMEPNGAAFNIGAHKAYLALDQKFSDMISGATGVKDFVSLNDEEDPTGISNVDVDADEVIYNIAGQRIGKMQKGINIVNGKKILK